MGRDADDNRWSWGKGLVAMITVSRSILADEWRSGCAVICDAQVQPKQKGLRACGSRNHQIHSTPPCSFRQGLGLRAISGKDTAIEISSGGCWVNAIIADADRQMLLCTSFVFGEMKMTRIPKNIIQFWHDNDTMPEKIKSARDITFANNSDYNSIFADDKFMYNLLEQKWRELYELYKLNRIPASRSDVARLILLYEYGGFYLDMSMEFCKSLNSIVDENDDIILVRRDDFPQYKNCPEDAHVINGIIGVIPHSEFIRWCILNVYNNLSRGLYNKNVWFATGPKTVNDALNVYRNSYNIKKLSMIELKKNYFKIQRITGVSNNWVNLQKYGIICNSFYRT